MSESQRPRIAIIMKKEDLGIFFQIEAELCGYETEICSVPPKEPSLYDLVLIDPEVGYCIPDGSSCRVIAIVEGTAKHLPDWAHTVWEWPISVETVRGIFEQVKFRQFAGERRDGEKAPIREKSSLYLISREEGKILYHNQTLTLTPREMTLLCTLSDAGNRPVSEEILRERLGGGQGNHVAVHICNLRKRLGAVSSHPLIETCRGRGYRLRDPLLPIKQTT